MSLTKCVTLNLSRHDCKISCMVMKIISPRKEVEPFSISDTIDVVYKIREDEKTRLQHFSGIVIAIKGADLSRTFTVRKITKSGMGVERILPLSSPNISSIKVLRRGKVRRSKLYYLRGRTGKGATFVKSA